MKINVPVPKMEDADEDATATVGQWLVKPGDAVNEDDDLVELTTDKAAITIPSPAKGKVAECIAEEGAEVKAGDILCILDP